MLKFESNTYQPIARIMQNVINNPILWDAQEARGVTPEVWTTDEWTIEVGKAILMGEEDYMKDITPVRRYDSDSPMFQKQSIINFAAKKFAMVEILRTIKDSCNKILICEMGAGLDVALAESVKNWDKIFGYDYNKHITDRTKNFFQNFKYDFVPENSSFYNFLEFPEEVILIADNMHIPYDEFKLQDNDKFKHIIWGGELKK